MASQNAPTPAPPSIEAYAALLSLAAHEFRTPASVVSGYLRMLQKETDPALTERQHKMVDEAMKSCVRLVALIAELGDIGHIDAGLLVPARDAFDLFADIEALAPTLTEGADRGVQLALHGAATGAMVIGDRARLRQGLDVVFRALLREQGRSVTLVCDRRIVTGPHGERLASVVVAPSDRIDAVTAGPRRPFDTRRSGVGLGLALAERFLGYAGGALSTSGQDGDPLERGVALVTVPLATGDASHG